MAITRRFRLIPNESTSIWILNESRWDKRWYPGAIIRVSNWNQVWSLLGLGYALATVDQFWEPVPQPEFIGQYMREHLSKRWAAAIARRDIARHNWKLQQAHKAQEAIGGLSISDTGGQLSFPSEEMGRVAECCVRS